MGKTKTSNKHKNFLGNMSKKTYHLKKGIALPKHTPFKTLTNERLIAQAFWEMIPKALLKSSRGTSTPSTNHS